VARDPQLRELIKMVDNAQAKQGQNHTSLSAFVEST